MMCVQRLQWLIQAFILGTILGLVGSGLFKIAYLLTVATMFMLLFAAVTGICPGRKILSKAFPPCEGL